MNWLWLLAVYPDHSYVRVYTLSITVSSVLLPSHFSDSSPSHTVARYFVKQLHKNLVDRFSPQFKFKLYDDFRREISSRNKIPSSGAEVIAIKDGAFFYYFLFRRPTLPHLLAPP